ncbi:hypothetical protein JI739_18590 [Ramlibacter sp. AW1]|uniref:Uncharacterized protein n=1 Tax=Ramlibacter aurantiacus TaxID=2801330 RepID=A0A937D7U1_9BURK|nr:hypothetical protein [Ramlibacter aurantiacus]MBL0422363.1 hypothetical protein [Ramlibacter aurantiacus]
MTMHPAPMPHLIGESFLDHSGQRWWVKERRPGSSDQLVVEATMQGKGSYPRVAVYVMTEREFQAHARASNLRPDRPTSSRER